MNTFGLTMIIKNGESAIRETLLAIRDHIDYYTILDTGSTDNTISIIKEVMGDRPGMIYEEPFAGFDVSRNRCLELHGTKTKWVTMLDDTYIINNIDNLKKCFKNVGNYDSFALKIKTKNSYEDSEYYSIRVWRTDAGIKYKYRIHEVPICKNTKSIDFDICYILDNVDSKMRLRSSRRKEYDIKMLLQHHKEDPKDRRIISYLGKYYMNDNDYEKSLSYFRKILESVEDLSDYEAAILSAKIHLTYKSSPMEEILKYLLMAIKIDPNRSESHYYAAVTYFQNGDYKKAYETIKKAIDIPFPSHVLEAIDRRIYSINIPYFYSFLSILFGYKFAAKKILKEKIKEFPQENIFKNLLYSIEGPESFSVTKYNEKILVLNTGEDESFWKPGDEITEDVQYIAKMFEYAKMFSKRGYAVTLFGKFIKGNKNNEGTYDFIECLDQSKYSEYVQKTFIDVLIVNDQTNNLAFYDNIGKIFLWNIGSFKGDILTVHPQKFGGIISDSKIFLEKMSTKNKIPIEKTILTPHPLDIEKIDSIKTDGKIPGRIVFSGSLDSKVDTTIEIFQKLKEKNSELSLSIIVDESCPQDLIEKSKSIPDIILVENLENNIIKEYKQAEYWIDPMMFTYPYQPKCILAQYCGCFCITNGHDTPYKDLIGNRGAIWKEYISKKNLSDFLKYCSTIIGNEALLSSYQMKGFNWAKNQTSDLMIDIIVSKFN